jgi:NAD(P)-dependent dehydrogenase (short-subunit alcohol dehydrogenase family)
MGTCTNKMDMTGKTVAVTGGASGIGKAICLEFADNGANVLVCDINLVRAQKVADEISETGRKSIAVKMDVTSESDTQAMVDLAVKTFGSLDIMINNAGIIDGMKKTYDLTVEEWDRTFAVNAKGVFIGCKTVIPQMRKQGYGRIINAASQMGKTAGNMIGHYSASKAAVILLTKTLAKELATENITVNCICPGSVDTEMTLWEAEQMLKNQGIPIEESYKNWESAIPMKRFAKPLDIAKVYVFLASEYADYMTGQAVNVSGGQEMH